MLKLSLSLALLFLSVSGWACEFCKYTTDRAMLDIRVCDSLHYKIQNYSEFNKDGIGIQVLLIKPTHDTIVVGDDISGSFNYSKDAEFCGGTNIVLPCKKSCGNSHYPELKAEIDTVDWKTWDCDGTTSGTGWVSSCNHSSHWGSCNYSEWQPVPDTTWLLRDSRQVWLSVGQYIKLMELVE